MGANLGLTDDSHVIIPIGFDFKFYGENYNQLSISTNGWIKPGLTNQSSFRNWRLPGAGGPSPMIAAFWDDMKTSSGGDVFYKEFSSEEGDFVVVEWSDMRTEDNNSEEDFQVILYSKNDNSTMDCEIKFQYK